MHARTILVRSPRLRTLFLNGFRYNHTALAKSLCQILPHLVSLTSPDAELFQWRQDDVQTSDDILEAGHGRATPVLTKSRVARKSFNTCMLQTLEAAIVSHTSVQVSAPRFRLALTPSMRKCCVSLALYSSKDVFGVGDEQSLWQYWYNWLRTVSYVSSSTRDAK